jgi:hypothetical protein
MLINKLTVETGEQVFLLDQVFDQQWLEKLHTLKNSAILGQAPWPLAAHFGGRPRYLHNESGEQWQSLTQYFASDEFSAPLELLIGQKLKYSTASIWADQRGFGALNPHKEYGGAYMMQVYLTDTPHDWTGTTIYNEKQQVLAQLPYRDNFGWFFHGMRVMHGRHHDVPEGITRFTLQIWFS